MDTKGSGIDHERLDDLRRTRDPIQEHIIDELVAGNLSRRSFLTKATAFGMSIPIAGLVLDAVEGKAPGTTARSSLKPEVPSSRKWNGVLNAGMYTPSSAINPIIIENQGGLEIIGNVGEFLVFRTNSNVYQPWLATHWSSNAKADVWTFTIRKGVKFNNGKEMTVDDVVYSFKENCNPANHGNALSVFSGTLKPDGVIKKGSDKVEFHLEAPDANFLDAVTSDNYNMIIVPKGTDYTNYDKKPANMVGTGRFKVSAFNASTGITFVRNPHYWGKAAKPKKVVVTFFADEGPMALALAGGSIDCMDQFSVATSPQLLNGSYNVTSLKAATHREASMRCDKAFGKNHPFANKYVRQALAHTIDREHLVKALFKGHAIVGNDTPFAPGVFPESVGPPKVPQRKKNLKLARELLKKGGYPRGFTAHLVTEKVQEIPDYVTILKQEAAAVGIDIKLKIESQAQYYGNATFGHSDWLDGEISVVDYGARSVPNLYLEAPLQSINLKTGQGEWNAAHFNNATYDKLSREYVAATSLPEQRKLAEKIENLLLDETPIIFAYFYDYLQASRKNCVGVYSTAQSQYFLWNAHIV
jgi:peptide/nickel transport system substrate-binding protein